MRVATERGWVVLASDTSHYYEHMETGRVFPTPSKALEGIVARLDVRPVA